MPINALLVRSLTGWSESHRDGGTYRREACLGLGAQQSPEEAGRIAEAQLDIYADPRDEVAADPKPREDSETPFIAYRTGDYLVAPDWYGTSTDQRVMSVGCALDDEGMITFSVELHDRILGESERMEQALKKFSNGTLRGNSKVATPTALVGKRNIVQPAPSGDDGGG
jgi:hypothetical protein